MNNILTHNIGVDILHLPRLISLFSRRPIQKFAQRILTPTELSEFQKLSATTVRCQQSSPSGSTTAAVEILSNPVIRFVATRWAAKEAAYKASTAIIMQTEEKWMAWKNFEVTRGGRGQPLLTIRDGEKVLGTGKISISHDGEYVIAMAMVPEKLLF